MINGRRARLLSMATHRRLVCGVALAIINLNPVPAAAGAAAGALRWPLDLAPAVVSSFGEYRYDHMHAGVDLSTGGAVGLPVHAAADGRVFRLKVEWRGYGRALYLKHSDGRISVYGHLERYEDAVLGLEKQVARRQREAGTRYPGDIYLDPPLPVRRGQVIAYSGESGVGLPHLHFEMRGAGDDPIDPFRNGLPPPRQGAPILESIVATAAGPDAWIDGVLREKTLALRLRNHVYEPEEPLRVSGPVRLDVSAWAPGGGGRAGIRFLEARVDGESCYRLDFDRFRFDQYPLAGLVYDHRFSHLGPTRMVWRLAALPGNALAQGGCRFIAGDAGGISPGAYGLADGAHRLEVIARDAAGAESVARVCIFSGQPPALAGLRVTGAREGEVAAVRFDPPDSPRSAPVGGAPTGAAACSAPAWRVEAGLWDGRRWAALDCRERDGVCTPAAGASGSGGNDVRIRQDVAGVPGSWTWGSGVTRRSPATGIEAVALPSFLDLVATLGSPGTAPEEATGCAVPDLAWRPLEGLRLGAGVAYADLSARARGAAAGMPGCALDQAVAPFAARWVAPDDAARVEGEGYRVEVPVGGRFFAGPLLVRTLPRGDLPVGLRAERDPVAIAPDGECLNARATLTFATSPGDPRVAALGIYRWDGDGGRWSFEGGDVDASGSGLALGFRRYGRFALLRDEAAPVIRSVRPAGGGSVSRRHVEVVASVEDLGKGLDHDGVSFLLDGTALESEFDPDRGTARPFDPPNLTAGRHHLKVQATDRAGNVSTPVEVDFTAR
jgi:hypothetical protein